VTPQAGKTAAADKDVVMFDITPPPAPQFAGLALYCIAGGCLAGGILVCLWGKYLGRAALCAGGMAAGLAIAGPVAGRLSLNLLAARLATATLLGAAGLLLARAIWATLAAAALGTAAVIALLLRYGGQLAVELRPAFQPAEASLVGWAWALCRLVLDGLAAVWSWSPLMAAGTVGPAVVLPLALAIISDRPGRIFVTSLLGAAAAVAGAMIAVSQCRPAAWSGAWSYWPVLVAVAAALMAAGMVVQVRGAIVADRAQVRQDQAEKDDQEGQAAADEAGR